MCSWTKVLTVILIVYLKCVIAYPRRTTYRVYRKSSSPPPFLAHLLSLPPSRAPPRNFNADYDLPPPFMMMPSMAPPSTSYGEPIMDYGPPRKEYPSSDYGPPPPTSMKPIIFKHIYVHIPPPEPPEMTTSRAPLTAAPPQKHYKIVFIKAPTSPTPTLPNIPAQPLDEEKTLVYVLVKKPDDPPKLVLPTPPSTQPSKPEVYFIRYKTQNEEQNNGPYPSNNNNNNISPTLGPPLAAYGAPPNASNRADTPRTTSEPETAQEYE